MVQVIKNEKYSFTQLQRQRMPSNLTPVAGTFSQVMPEKVILTQPSKSCWRLSWRPFPCGLYALFETVLDPD